MTKAELIKKLDAASIHHQPVNDGSTDVTWVFVRHDDVRSKDQKKLMRTLVKLLGWPIADAADKGIIFKVG